jgi:hypothetical protein
MIKEKPIGEQIIKVDRINHLIDVRELGSYLSDRKGVDVLKYVIAYKYYFNDILIFEFPLERSHKLSLIEALRIQDALKNNLQQGLKNTTLKPIFQQN